MPSFPKKRCNCLRASWIVIPLSTYSCLIPVRLVQKGVSTGSSVGLTQVWKTAFTALAFTSIITTGNSIISLACKVFGPSRSSHQHSKSYTQMQSNEAEQRNFSFLKSNTERKYYGGMLPSAKPSERITLFFETKKGILCSPWIAFTMLSSMTTWHEDRMPEITPSLPGVPIARCTWLRAILLRPPFIIRGKGSK